MQKSYVFVAILLYWGMRGIDEIPLDAKFMANVFNADTRTNKKSFEKLIFHKLLLKKKKEREKKKTDTQTETNGVCVSDFNSFENEEKEEDFYNKRNPGASADSNSHRSNYSMQECMRYVELCQSKGDQIANPRALATNLFRTGESDAFILGMLYPERVAELNKDIFGEPLQFSDAPCSVCFGAKMADKNGKGFAACDHCKNERNNSTGYEPEGEKNEALQM